MCLSGTDNGSNRSVTRHDKKKVVVLYIHTYLQNYYSASDSREYFFVHYDEKKNEDDNNE